MNEDVRLHPFPIENHKLAEETRLRLAQKCANKSSYEVNFVMSHVGTICCFDGNIAYITDDNLQPILFYESKSFFNSCYISDTAKYAVFQMAYNKENDADSGATALFDVKGKRLIARSHLPTGWKGGTHLFIDEKLECLYVYYGDKKVKYDFSLRSNTDMLEAYFRENSEVSPYLLNSRAQELISKTKEKEIEWETVEKEVLFLLERLSTDADMSQYQLSITYRELGDLYSEHGETQKAIESYEIGLSLNPSLPVKRKLNQERKKALSL